MKLTKAFLTAFLGAATIGASAQGYYDDDIYYDASKDTKAKEEIAAHKKAVEEERIRQQQQYEAEMAYWRSLANQQSNYNPNLGGEDYAAADTYALPGTGSARNVDEYNRRGITASSSQSRGTSATSGNDDFAYTRRIERFHNGDIIASTNDPALVDYYYSSAASQPDINIYVVNPGWNSWRSWGWGPSWYDPWWPSSPYWAWNYWGPSWSFGWNSWWGPSWSWGWGAPGWGPSWGWGPGFGPGWGGGWAWQPGNYTPNGRRSTGIRNGYTGFGSSHPGSPFNTGSRGRSGSSVTRQSLGNYRPGGSSSAPASNGTSVGNYRPGNGSAPSYSPSYNNGSNSNSGVYRSGRGSSRSSSTPSYSSPSRSGNSGWGGGSSSGRGGSNGGGGHSSRSGRR